ncbi:MAG TPA: NADH-quinone oxidoreductase subunit L [Thermoanaerobaculia bacterium]|nr:NADH-quinone oxidoreductase subunit L [Thermoanaerobaculia bacterium]
MIPALPLAGFLLCGLLGPKLGKRFVTLAGVGSVALSTAAAYWWLSIYVFSYLPTPGLFDVHQIPMVETVGGWISAGGFSADLSLRLDQLSALMLSFITFVGLLIHIYSVGYMNHESDAGYARYFAYLNLFLFAMLVLVLANNFLLMFVGWEGVGLCSYLLIGYFYDREYAAAAGKKAFIVNRIGDFGFLLGLFGLVSLFGSLDYDKVFPAAAADPSRYAPALTAVCLCLFVGAMGKSAQVPLHVWLPDAMAGPTPVSALIHAATMVTAGVYMVTRCNVLFRLAPEAMLVVAVIGGVTAIFAAVIALAQNDIKKVLAYSTVSQLGYMFLACGVGAYVAGMFHVMTHAFFKACLFLGSGSVIHAMGDEQDMRKMGGLKNKLPVTYATFLVATLALAGIPPLAGFFSKDAILTSVFAWRPDAAAWLPKALFSVGLLTAGLTAFYMFRLVSMTFYGKFRGTPDQEHHLHESPRAMTVPLIALAVLSVVAGWIGLPAVFGENANRFETFLKPILLPLFGLGAAGESLSHGTEWALIGISVAVATAGVLLGLSWYARDGGRTPARIAAALPGLYALVADKFRVDELYARIATRPFEWLCRVLWKVVDVLVIDGILNAVAFLIELAGDALRFLQTGNVRNYALSFFLGTVALMLFLLGAGW